MDTLRGEAGEAGEGDNGANGRANRWLSVQNVADDLEINATTVRRMIKKGDLPAYRIGGEYRVRAAEYPGWLQNQRVAPEEEP